MASTAPGLLISSRRWGMGGKVAEAAPAGDQTGGPAPPKSVGRPLSLYQRMRRAHMRKYAAPRDMVRASIGTPSRPADSATTAMPRRMNNCENNHLTAQPAKLSRHVRPMN